MHRDLHPISAYIPISMFDWISIQLSQSKAQYIFSLSTLAYLHASKEKLKITKKTATAKRVGFTGEETQAVVVKNTFPFSDTYFLFLCLTVCSQ